MRANLRAATNEVGAAQAVRRLGSLRRLASDYLEAEYGQGGSRHRRRRHIQRSGRCEVQPQLLHHGAALMVPVYAKT